jgi:hypothetical protein
MRAVIRRKLTAASQRSAALPPAAVSLEEPKLTADQAAAALGLSASTVREKYGHAPGVIRIGRGRRQLIRFPASVLRRILEANTVR